MHAYQVKNEDAGMGSVRCRPTRVAGGYRKVANGIRLIGALMIPVVPWSQVHTPGQGVAAAGRLDQRGTRWILLARNDESMEMTRS